MTRRSHLAAWLLLWLAGLVAWPLWIGPERLAALAQGETLAAQRTFGPRLSAVMLRTAAAVQRGVAGDEAASTDGAYHPEAAGGAQAGRANEAPSARRGRGDEGARTAAARRYLPVVSSLVIERADRYLASLRLQLHGAVLRASGLVAWALMLAPLWLAAVVDGFTQRQVKAATFGYQNPAAFALALHALIAITMLPLVALVLPLPLPAWAMPAWGVVAMVPLRVAVAHLQPVFTR